MSKSPILAVAAMMVATVVTARTVELPVAKSKTDYTIIRSVELTDTATRFNMSMIKLPGQKMKIDTMVIKGRATKKIYPLLRSEGYVPGTSIEIGENGRYDYVNVFPALDPTDSIVDMYDKTFPAKVTDMYRGINLGQPVPRKYKTHLHGRHEGKSGFLAVFEASPRLGDRGAITWIPVDNGCFSATFSTDKPVFYQIADGKQYFGGSLRTAYFMPEGEEVEVDFICNTEIDDIDEVIVRSTSGSQTQAYSDYFKAVNELFNQASDKSEFFSKVLPGLRIDMAMKMRNFAGLFALVNDAWHSKDVSDYLAAYRDVYRGMYPGHPYSEMFEELDQTYEPLPSNPYNDFTAPDFEGNEHRLSDLIKGRPALIDLWGSSCGSCRVKSKSMIPVYNEYAPKGFTIVGVAREFGGPDFGVKAIKKDGYPWLNLLELDDRGGIWALYRIQSAMGGTFLVGADGKIVAVNPTTDEVREYLQKTLE